MKKRNILFILLLALIVPTFFLAGCGDKKPKTFTVTFNSMGGSAVESVNVKQNTRITKPTNPTHPQNFEFLGWCKEEELNNFWIFETDIVKENLTLYAKWKKIFDYPSNITTTNEPFSSKLTWTQNNVNKANTQFTVKINNVVVDGTWEVGQNGYDIIWTPNVVPQGGTSTVTISTTKQNIEIEDVTQDVNFKGAGTESNPYLIYKNVLNYLDVASLDFKSIVESAENSTTGTNLFYKQMDNFNYEAKYTNDQAEIIKNVTFNGVYDGNGKTITLSGNMAPFYKLGENAVIKNLKINGSIATTSIPSIGAIANYNLGTIENCTVSMGIKSEAGIVGDFESREVGGAGGIVGTNEANGKIKNCLFDSANSSSNSIKAINGSGGIAGTNFGTIENCKMKGCLGAFNTVENGKTLAGYSYVGGIAGYNFGTIKQSELTGVGKILAQRYWNTTAPDTTERNIVIGGIAGYNSDNALVTECVYEGVRVHGDQYVGGIVGINKGNVNNCISGLNFISTSSSDAFFRDLVSYVGGRKDVGGIVGLNQGTNASVTNCLSAVNVYAYESTPYSVCETASNCVYATNNPNARPNNHTYGAPISNTLTAPNGTNNVAFEIELNSNIKTDIIIPSSFLTTLGEKFAYSETEGVKLAFQINS